MPRALSKEEREARDALVLQMFIAGVPYRNIGKNPRVQVSAPMVCKIVKREMAKGGERREYIAENAYQVHTERLESLYAANYATAVNSKAIPQDRIRAGLLCARLLEQLGKLHGLTEQAILGGGAPTRLMDDGGDDETEDEDELSAYRKRSREG